MALGLVSLLMIHHYLAYNGSSASFVFLSRRNVQTSLIPSGRLSSEQPEENVGV